jgi:hypothetical protein
MMLKKMIHHLHPSQHHPHHQGVVPSKVAVEEVVVVGVGAVRRLNHAGRRKGTCHL